MSACIGVKRTDPDEAMHAALGFGVAESIGPLDPYGRLTNTRLFPRLNIKDLRFNKVNSQEQNIIFNIDT